jgi:hypothetical protein
VFENGVLRLIYRTKTDEARGGWGRLHNEELHNPFLSPNLIRMITSRMMRWQRHGERMRENRNAYKIIITKPVLQSVS